MESIKKNRDFQNVYQNGRSLANKYLIMYLVGNQSAVNRVGLSISKKVGNSVVRHRIRRLLKEVCRLHDSEFEHGYDIVIIARLTAKRRSYREMESAVLHLGRRHQILKGMKEVS
jgi:ribonuclease P protein component